MTCIARSGRRSTAAAVSLLAGLALAACGGGSDTVEETESGLVSISVMRPANTGFEPVVLADEQGFFEEQGLEVTFVEASADTSANIPRLLNGEVQFVNGGAPQAIKAVANGVEVRLITGVQGSTAGAAPTDGLLVPPGSAVTSFADLEGKKIGLSGIGGTTNLVNNILARQAGVDPSAFTYVNLDPSALQEAASSGQVDAILPFGLYYSKAVAEGFVSLTDGTTELPGTLQIGYLTTTEYLDEHADIVEKFNAAIAEGVAYANDNPDAVRDTQREYTELPDDYIDAMEPIPYSTEINVDTTHALAEELVKIEAIDAVPADEDIFWSEAPTT
ncbi:ABC transporter substrate-binding protein [Nocardioides sp.]|uniref:ABC transporter substrate-binding protein n=1 Tax=Nocardioides sp. TaxID=35761 RepID=UPI0039E28E58